MNKEIDITQQQASRHLGNNVIYSDQYNADLLVAIERIHNRKKYNIDSTNLPFIGYDTWHAYEVSFLLENGFPISCTAKIVYPANSRFIIESKSFKLYLNSFNMTRYSGYLEEVLLNVKNTIIKDLSSALETKVDLSFHFIAANNPLWSNDPYEDFISLENIVDIESIQFTQFHESPDILITDINHKSNNYLRVQTCSLRSNCRITNQPDWGDAFIHIEGENIPTRESLLQYIVSMRKEAHFHEEITECIYQRLWDKFKPKKLMVTCIYTRRGGIDICPARASHPELLSENLHNCSIHVAKILRQ